MEAVLTVGIFFLHLDQPEALNMAENSCNWPSNRMLSWMNIGWMKRFWKINFSALCFTLTICRGRSRSNHSSKTGGINSSLWSKGKCGQHTRPWLNFPVADASTHKQREYKIGYTRHNKNKRHKRETKENPPWGLYTSSGRLTFQCKMARCS